MLCAAIYARTMRTSKKDVPVDRGAESVSYSTRFDPEQREVVEAAAKKMNWKPAKLIREASVGRAVDILNACEPADRRRLRELVGVVLCQILDPKYSVRWYYRDDPDQDGVTRIYSYRNPHHDDQEFSQEDWAMGMTPTRPSESDIMQIREALRTCGTEFLRMLLDEWHSFEPSGACYKPKVDPGRLLGGLPSGAETAEKDD